MLRRLFGSKRGRDAGSEAAADADPPARDQADNAAAGGAGVEQQQQKQKPAQAAGAVERPAKAQAAAAEAAAAPASPPKQGDGGAALYHKLASNSKGSSSGSVDVAPRAAMPGVKTTKKGAKAIDQQSQRVRQKRLMKELKDIQTCLLMQEGVFSVELADDNLFEWDIKVFKFDPESPLARDLDHMHRRYNIDNVWFRFSFPANFPFAPPFVRVLAPLVQGGFVLPGGAICMELLTPDGWSQAYKMEAVIMQLMATVIKGNARIVPSVSKQFSESEAQKSFDYLVKTHAKYGWSTPPKAEG